jgi:hypothetical protein
MACSEHSAGPSDELLLANWFRFSYRGKAITFTPANIAGQPVMSVGAQQFYGDEITMEPSAIGDLVTVVLEAVADGDTTLLTLVLPPMRVRGFEEIDATALAVRTTVRGTLAGPPEGVGHVYKVQELEGRASFIVS